MRTPLLLALIHTACGPKSATAPEASVEPPPEPTLSQVVLADMDRTADPCTDFYQYACGGWLDRTELPADKPSWTRSFSVIAEENRTYLRDLLESAANEPDQGDADWAKMGRYYGACMNEEAVESHGTEALQPLLEAIDAIEDHAGLMPVLARVHSIGISALLDGEVEGDFKDPQLTILHLSQGGLSLPDRDYYLTEDEEGLALLEAYQGHVAEVFGLAGADEDTASHQAQAVRDFETALAQVHWPRADTRDPTKIYDKIDRAGLESSAPELDWGAWLTGMGGENITDINVQPEVIAATAKLIQQTELPVLAAYLRWRTLQGLSRHLPAAFVDANADFFGRQVYGQQQIEDRWKRCVRNTDSALGEIVGRYFVEERFAGDSKDKAVAMIEGIQDAFEQQLPALEWMDEATRQRAIEKKNTLVNMIGYPDKWREYPFEVGENHLANVLASHSFEHDDAISRVGQPTDPSRWYMSPPQVNAYYHPLFNQMVFPAGILQPPFFKADFPMAMNFGGIGLVMGHELTHGFDDSGRKFDPQGRMVEWWEPETAERFETRAQCVEEQFDGYQVEDGLNVNGKLTLGENIADLGGLKSSFRAWKAWDAEHGPTEPAIEGLTNDQLLFVNFGQTWCSVSAPEFEKMLVLSNPHSPARFRVNGPVTNLPEFHETFSCEVGAALRPENSCTVW